MASHTSVLEKEVLEYLNCRSDKNFVDGTIGEAGHTLKILEKSGPKGKVLGIDRDPGQIENCQEIEKSFNGRLILVNDSFANLKAILEKTSFGPIDGILLDLGVSSWQLEKVDRGFSFQIDGPLDMRYSGSPAETTASDIVNRWPEQDIERIIKDYGEEKFARKIAKEIIEARKIRAIGSTFQLVEIIKKAVPRRYQVGRIHFATRTFQALRISVNDELSSLEIFLPQATEALKAGGRMAIISFHSLEDRIVKNFFKQSMQSLKIITKKPITPSEEEIKTNSRSRSAKLRVAEKII